MTQKRAFGIWFCNVFFFAALAIWFMQLTHSVWLLAFFALMVGLSGYNAGFYYSLMKGQKPESKK